MSTPKKTNSLIGLELAKLEKKIKQYQEYLEEFNIRTMKDQAERHKEIDCQIKIMNALPNWLASLEKLYGVENEKKEIEIRGGEEMNGMMKLKFKKEQDA